MAKNTLEAHKELIRGIAVTIMLITFSAYMPVIGFISAVMVPFPIMIHRVKLGKTRGAVIPVTAFMMSWIFLGGPLSTFLFFGVLLFLGFILGDVMMRNLSIEITFLYTSAAVLATVMAGAVILSLGSQQPLIDQLNTYIEQNLEMTLALYEQQGMSENTLLVIENSLDKIQHILVRILPGLITSVVLFVIWINVLTARSMARKLQFHVPDFGPLNHWKASDHLVWTVISCGLMLLLPVQALNLIALNGLIVLMTLYFFQGIAIVSFYLEKRNFPPILKSFCYGLIFLQQFLTLIVIGIGFFDTWLNFRKLEFNNNY